MVLFRFAGGERKGNKLLRPLVVIRYIGSMKCPMGNRVGPWLQLPGPRFFAMISS
jgi:hypothetical protein